MSTPAERVNLTAYLRGSFFPPLPLEYVDWVASLLPDMEHAVWEAESAGNFKPIDAMVPVPDAVISTAIMPKASRDLGDGPVIRLGDLISALRLYDRFTSSYDGPEDQES